MPSYTPPEDRVFIRKPYDSELEFFRNNPHVGGMAAEDGRVILNPFSSLTDQERQSVALNEAARIHMRRKGAPRFDITEKQKNALKNYGGIDDIRSTIAARILSGDPSAQDVTDEQRAYVDQELRPYVRQPEWLR